MPKYQLIKSNIYISMLSRIQFCIELSSLICSNKVTKISKRYTHIEHFISNLNVFGSSLGGRQKINLPFELVLRAV